MYTLIINASIQRFVRYKQAKIGNVSAIWCYFVKSEKETMSFGVLTLATMDDHQKAIGLALSLKISNPMLSPFLQRLQ